MIKLAVLGAAGRMGGRVLECAAADERLGVVAALVRPGDPRVGQQRAGLTLAERTDVPFDVLVDFSTPAGTMPWLERCVTRRCAMVIGTTGHSGAEQARIEEAAGAIAILKAANFSVGINVLLSLVGRLAAELGDDYDIEIVEAHHRAKVDAPSGTALWLLQAITEATGRDPHTDVVHGRSGAIGPRPPRQIGVHALRLGDNPGCHTIHFATAGERLSLTHAATSRDTFARGALRAAEWVARRRPGMYTMADCLDAR